MYRIGLDIGSTTIKCVVYDENENIIYKSYERHLSRVRQKTFALLSHIEKEIVKSESVKLAITGSSGLGLCQNYNLPFVQEVYATQLSAKNNYPDIDVIIELGGEDAKILFLSGVSEVRMNGSCAGGTGSFIDQMAVLLGLSLEEFDKLALTYKQMYTIASRCGVFAKSDIQPLINQGAQKNDLAASIFGAVINQTIGGLAQGRDITGKVLFLGGPLSFFKSLQKQFVSTLNLSENNAIFPENAQYFIAMGAAIYSKNTQNVLLKNVLENLNIITIAENTKAIPPLFENKEEYENFHKRHSSLKVGFKDITTYQGDAYLGVDAGSTTTKLVLICKNGDILYQKYISNQGNAVPIVRSALMEIYSKTQDRIVIKSSAVTGYGEELIKNAFKLNNGIVETVAHYTAAKHFVPNVDFIIDIGGQDIKCFKLKQGAVDSIMLNEACSSGCGSFLQTFAAALNYTVKDFAKEGLYSKRPVDLGSRCTVFMNSSVKQAQKEGANISDISAGLSISVVKNAIYKVIRAVSPSDLGENIVVQGGTFLNDAVLRAFERELNINVTRTPISGLMGAYGCALYASNNYKKSNTEGVISLDELKKFTHTVSNAVCKNCENHCKLTINKFNDDKLYVSGNICNKFSNNNESQIKFNSFEYKYKQISSPKSSLTISTYGGDHPNTAQFPNKPNENFRGKIGIPLALNNYENLPFWNIFFEKLGFEVVINPRSSRDLYLKGQHTIPSDTVCYPAKLVHGQIEALTEMGVNAIFYPCLPYNFDEKLGDNHYNCPVVAYYPEVIEANVTIGENTAYIADYFGLHRPKDFMNKIYTVLSKYFDNIKKSEVKTASNAAYKTYANFKRKIVDYTKRAIEYARENSKPIIVLAGRPYHIDPEINHGIDKLLASYGAVVITEDGLSHIAKKADVKVLNQWTYHSRLYTAAEYVCEHDDMNLVQLVSFGCGVDSITSDEVRKILEEKNKLYTQIKIDEIANLGAVKIRLRSLFAAIKERKKG